VTQGVDALSTFMVMACGILASASQECDIGA